jgi:hypothetical protein
LHDIAEETRRMQQSGDFSDISLFNERLQFIADVCIFHRYVDWDLTHLSVIIATLNMIIHWNVIAHLFVYACKRLFPGLELLTLWSQGNNFTAALGLPLLKGQPGACSSHLRRVRGRVRLLWVFCTQPFPAFLQETVSRT